MGLCQLRSISRHCKHSLPSLWIRLCDSAHKTTETFQSTTAKQGSQAHDPESAQEWSEWLMLGIRCLPDRGLGTCIVSIITHTLASARIILGVRGLPLRACPGGQAAHGPNPTKTGGVGEAFLPTLSVPPPHAQVLSTQRPQNARTRAGKETHEHLPLSYSKAGKEAWHLHTAFPTGSPVTGVRKPLRDSTRRPTGAGTLQLLHTRA